MSEQEFIDWFKESKESNEKYIGTKKYTYWIHNAVNMGKDFPRQDVLEISLVNLYIDNYMRMWENTHLGQKFDSKNIFKIRLPKWIKLVENARKRI